MVPPTRLEADFNGLFQGLLCLSHSDTSRNDSGETVTLLEGMEALAYADDGDEDGAPLFLVARGQVQRSPEWLQCQGSRWCLRINDDGVRHVTTLDEA